jgi:hypothetical protein
MKKVFGADEPDDPLTDVYFIGAGFSTDIAPRTFGLTTFDFKLRTGIYLPFLGIGSHGNFCEFFLYTDFGFPLNVFRIDGNGSRIPARCSTWASRSASPARKRTSGGFEYRANFTTEYIGSVGLYLFMSVMDFHQFLWAITP